ncbi:hypothetical protein BC828DRAFT_376345 [Blastocladiella britannica]|nr:hypothetical protein BC828DRAFT_376345 [Blastocladiella britannica]
MPQNACNHQNTLPTSLCPPDAIALRASLTTAIISGKCISSSTRRPVFPSAGLLQRYLSLVDPGLFDSVSRNGGACIRASENEIGRHTCGWDTEAAACANGCRADGLVCTGGPPLPPPPPAPPSAPAPPTLPVPPSPSGSPLPSTTLDPSFTTPDPIPTSTTASGPPTLPTTAENPPQSTVQPGPSPTGQTLPPLTSVDPSSGTGTGNGGMVQDQSAAGSSGLRSGTAVGLSIGGGVAVLAIAVAVAGYASHRRQARSRAMEQHHLHGPQQLSGGTTLSTAVGTAVGSEPLGGGSGGGSLTDLARRLSNGAGTGGRRVPSSSGLRPVAFAPNPFLSVSSSKDAGGSASAVAAPPLVDTRANGASRFNSDRRTPAASASSRSAQPWPERHSLTVSHYPSLPRQQQQQSSGDDRGSLSSGKSSGHDISPILARLPPVPPEIEDDGSAIQRVLVEVEFEPTLDDELGLVPGDRVRVIQAFQDGWAAGMLEGTDRYGVFPLACSTPIVDE